MEDNLKLDWLKTCKFNLSLRYYKGVYTIRSEDTGEKMVGGVEIIEKARKLFSKVTPELLDRW